MGEGADTVEGLEESFAKFDSIVSGREGKAAYDARMEAWKKDWGYLPRDRDNPLDDPFVRSTIERARARFAVDKNTRRHRSNSHAFANLLRGRPGLPPSYAKPPSA